MTLIDKVRLRFMKDDEINQYKIFGNAVRFSFHPYWFRHSYREIFEEQVYKFETREKFPLIIDCGSNIGLSVIYFKRNHPGSRIISFEPDKNIFALLQHNLSASGCLDKVELHNQAVWIEDTTLKFHSTGGMGGAICKDRKANENIIDVEAVRLRNFLKERVEFLKIDIEGPEIEVLADCKDLLHNVVNIFIEYHCLKGANQKLDELLVMLKEAGFRYYIRQAYENMQFPYVQHHGEFMDIQLNIFAFRNSVQ